jgi:outer membrane receptor protein involved in Fe transport
MTFTRWVALGASVAFLATVPGSDARAQGSTTGAITGLITDAAGRPLENAQVQVVNRSTGFTTGQQTRANGRYYVQNLEVGPNYTLTVRLIGYSPVTREGIRVTLTQATRVDVQLAQSATQLSAVTVTAAAARNSDVFSATKQGVTTTVSDTLIRRIPNLDRDFTSLVRLTPQVTAQTGGFSAAGSNPRLGQFTIDGANQTDRFGLNSTGGQPGGQAGGRLIPIDAVKEVQVALTPTDIRQGNFASVLVNAVTRNGTNTFTGGLNYTYRNPSLARDTAFVRTGNLRQAQFGGFVGGPIIRDRLHFFAALERQERTNPNGGPSFTGGLSASDTVTGGGGVTLAQVQRAQAAARAIGFEAGSPEVLRLGTPLTNFVGRLDFRLNNETRFVFRQLVNEAQQEEFSRNATGFQADPNIQGSGIRLTSNSFARDNKNYSSVVQAFTNLSRGASNEFTGAFNRLRDVRNTPVSTPEISVSVPGVPATAGGAARNSQITFGTEQFSPVNVLRQDILELTDNFTIPLNAHTVTLGARFEYNRIFNDFQQRAFGAYKFSSLDSLERREPTSYSIAYANGPSVAADFRSQMFSAYAQDQWAATPRLTVTGGVRMDVPRFPDRPAYNQNITNGFARAGIYGISTTNVPKTRALFSPRLGVNWDVAGNQTFQLRANAGVYTGQPPYILIGNAYQNTGLGLAFLNCSGTASGTGVPEFTTNVNALPTACRNGTPPQRGSAGTAGVNLTDPNFRFPQRFVTSFGFDKTLPGGLVLSGEALYGRDINGIRVRDLNIRGPRQINGQDYTTTTGRTLYADTISSTQNAAGVLTQNGVTVTNANQRIILTNGQNNVAFGEGAIYLTNQSKAYNYAFTPTLRKRFGANLDLNASYTYTRAFEVQAFTSDRAISLWRNGREYNTRENEDQLTTSTYELRHRVQFFGTVTAPWKRFPTDLSFDYSGNTGSPLTYTANGDLNGDGFNGNDPIYIPRNATDPNEIRIVRLRNANAAFNATTNPYELNPAAAQSFENFIAGQKCLREQRGRIMERNSCLNPWQNLLNVSVRQTLPAVRTNRVTAQLDVFNFPNLLNKEWGVNRRAILSAFSQQQALQLRQRLPGPLSNESLNQYEFNSSLQGTDAGTARVYQDLVNSISNVYRMQLTFRYTF